MESLYTIYRPQTFADVAGQRPIVGALERAVLSESVGHAYLFCGPRGTGKTTMARILAKALLCEAGPGVLPDGTCEQCQAIALGVHPDVLEIDAASRTSVNDVREEIISKVDFAPVLGRYKVYVIDEVHMLSVAAFNALLKTLEEPPSHVVFILCTTDPQKVPATILSRVQRFNFLPLTDSDMLDRLNYICEHEGYHAEPEALELIVRHAHGGMRDAISTLEQLAIFGEGTISQTLARDLLGATSEATLRACMEALAAKDGAALFTLVGQVVGEGQDLRQFAGEVLRRARDLYVVFCAGVIPELLGASQVETEELVRESQLFGSAERISRVMSELDDLGWKLRDASNARLELEVALTKLVRPEADLTLEALAERVAQLEANGASGAAPRLAGKGFSGAGELAGGEAALQPVDRRTSTPDAMSASSDGQGGVPPRPERTPAGTQQKPQEQPIEPSVRSQERNASSWGSSAPQSQWESPKPATMRASAPASSSFEKPSRPSVTPAGASHTSQTPPSQPQSSASPAQTSESVAKPSAAQSQSAVQAPSSVQGSRPPARGPELAALWDQVLAGLPPVRGALLAGSRAVEDDGVKLTVAVDASPLTQGMLARTDVVAEIEQALKPVFGTRRFAPRYEDGSTAPVAPAPSAGMGASASSWKSSEPAPMGGFATSRASYDPAPQSAPLTAPVSSAIPPTAEIPPWEEIPAPTASSSRTPAQAPAAPTSPWPPAQSIPPAQSASPVAQASSEPQAPAPPTVEAPPQFSEALSQLSSVFGEVRVISVEEPGAGEPSAASEGPAY